MEWQNLINADPDVLSGQSVFNGTRVPVESLFDHSAAGISLNDFPAVNRQQAVAVLETAGKLMNAETC